MNQYHEAGEGMKKHNNIQLRLLSLILCFAMLLQSGFVMPAFAAGRQFTYSFNYNEQDIISENHAVLIPASVTDPTAPQSYYGIDEPKTTDTTLSPWAEEPYRIIGYDFGGWWIYDSMYEAYKQEIKEDTMVTDDILSMIGNSPMVRMGLTAKWDAYQSADINSGTVKFQAQNANGEYLPDNIEIVSSDDGAAGFDKDKQDYNLYVYGDTAKLNISFDQYEPDASSEITVIKHDDTANPDTVTASDTAAAAISDITAAEDDSIHAYYYNEDGSTFERHDEVAIGKRYVSEYFDMGEKNTTTDVVVKVTMPETGINKIYTFHVYRYGRELKANYGNMPYGEMSKRYSSNPERLTTEKASFDSGANQYKYNNKFYSPKAWQYKGGTDADEVKKGYSLTDDDSDLHYYNYDKDDTAIAVYSGLTFTDPGVVLYDDNGNELSLDSNTVKRKIIYKTVPSLKHASWATETPEESAEVTLTDAGTENEIDILKDDDKPVKPGVYRIEYSYEPGSTSEHGTLRKQTITRYFIVLPQTGDTNMDTYLSALDSLVYDDVPEANKNESDNIYLYRGLDVKRDGFITDADKDIILKRSRLSELYTSISTAETKPSDPAQYTVSTTETSGKAQLYMDFLGTDENNIKTVSDYNAADYTGVELAGNSTFYVGYRFKNLADADLTGKTVKSITMSVDYDQRYILPYYTTMSLLATWIKTNNTNLASVKINENKNTAAQYEFDKSTSQIYPWTQRNEVRTLTIEIFPASDMTLQDGYFLKLPFKVKNVPPQSGTTHLPVISAHLDAKGFNMYLAEDGGYMWDMSQSFNSITANLINTTANGKIEYMGDCELPFGEADPAIELDEPAAVYGTSWSHGGFEANSTAEGLPKGLNYYQIGTIEGIPEETGEFTFRVGGKNYHLNIAKAPMLLKADAKTKVYGEENPELTFAIDPSSFKNAEADSEAVDSEGNNLQQKLYDEAKGKVHLSCSAGKTSNVGSYTISFDEESSQTQVELGHYYLTFEDNSLTVTPRIIKITDVPDTDIPTCSIQAFPGPVAGSSTSFTSAYSDVSGDKESNTEGVLTEDVGNVTITYSVEYQGEKSSAAIGKNKPVKLLGSTIAINKTGRGSNYELAENHADITKNTAGEITNAKIKRIAAVQSQPPALNYVYGNRMNLKSGRIQITYEDGTVVPVNYYEAIARGLKIDFYNTETGKVTLPTGQTVHDYPLKVSDSGLRLYVTVSTEAAVSGGANYFFTNPISVTPQELTIKPEAKERYYGCDDPAFTYTITGGQIITDYGDKEEDVITNVSYETNAVKDSDIGDDYYITMSADAENGANPSNYSITCEESTLTVKKRPIKITDITNIPELYSYHYLNSDGTSKGSSYTFENETAVAGALPSGTSASMTVDEAVSGVGGLYTNSSGTADPIKIEYDVEYTVGADGTGKTVKINNLKLSEDYGEDDYYIKTKNYELADGASIDKVSTGVIHKKEIYKVKVKRPLRTSYTYGEELDLLHAEDDYNAENILHIVYDNDKNDEHGVDITFKDAVTEAQNTGLYWSVEYKKNNSPWTLGKDNGSGTKDGKKLQVADSGAVIVLTAKSLYHKDGENDSDFIYAPELSVGKKQLEVKSENLFTTYNEPIPDLNSSIAISGFVYGETEDVITKPTVTCYDGNNPVAKGSRAGSYTLHLNGGTADNYSFKFVEGSLIIGRRPLTIKDIVIPTLTAEQAYEAYKNNKKYTVEDIVHYTTDTTEVDGAQVPVITFKDAVNGLQTINGVRDEVFIQYTITYEEAPLEGTAAGETIPVTVTNARVIQSDEKVNSYRNYYIVNETNKQTAKVQKALISSITVTDDPTLDAEGNQKEYIYGDSLPTGKCTIVYDSSRTVEDVDFADLSDYGITVAHPYENRDIKDEEWGNIFLQVGNDKSLTLVPSADDKAENYDGTNASTGPILVSKRPVDIKINNLEYTYGDTPPTDTVYSKTDVEGKYSFSFDESMFAPGEQSFNDAFGSDTNYKAPTLSCIIDGDEPKETTDAGTYDISLAKDNDDNYLTGESSNYIFVFKEADKGELKVNKRKLVIQSIDSIPMLKTDVMSRYRDDPTAKIKVSGNAVSKQAGILPKSMTIEEGHASEGIANDDLIGITFDAYYDNGNILYDQEVNVEIDTDSIQFITGVVDGNDFSQCKNYTISEPLPSMSSHGKIEEPQITAVTVKEDPTKMRYTYGDVFELSGGKIEITFNDYFNEYTDFENYKDYNLKVTYESTAEEVRLKVPVSRVKHDGSYLIVTAENGKNGKTNNPLSVEPREMHVIIEPQSYVYGENPPVLQTNDPYPAADGTITDGLYRYDAYDLVNGDTFLSDNFKNGLSYKIPQLSCQVTNISDAGEYEITGSDKLLNEDIKSNYKFTYETGTMTVSKRPVKVESIDTGVPVLTSELIYKDRRNEHSIAGYATTDMPENKMTVSNLIKKDGVNYDKIKILYNAKYTDTAPNSQAPVYIDYTGIDASEDKYKLGANYYISSDSTGTATGEIKDKEIEKLRILNQPVLDYIYGDPLNLDSGVVEVTYDDGSKAELHFADLPAGKTKLVYSDNTEAKNHDVLYVKYHNNNTITVLVNNPNKTVDSVTTQPLKVYKKQMNIDAEDIEVIYGDNVVYKWDYRESDFVNGDTKTSRSFTRGLIAPEAKSYDYDNMPVDTATSVGIYKIIVSGGMAENYEFVYNSAKLTINKRPLDILSIDDGVPALTAKVLHEKSGPTYRLDGTAVNTQNQMTVGNLVNGDSVKVMYTAVYTNGKPSDNVAVVLDNIRLDNSYGKSSNYTLAYKALTSAHGSIIEPNIESIAIMRLPRLNYEYGDELNLSNGLLRVTYDDAEYDDVSFIELTSISNKYNISMKYDGKKAYVTNYQPLDLSYDNERFEFTVNDSIYTIPVLTANSAINVTKRVLNYGACIADPIIYDGETTLTTGKIVFVNPADNENPTASGIFNYTDFNAGNNILVNITDIKLDREWESNYTLSKDSTTTYGNINKAPTSVPEGNIEYDFSEATNTLTITPFVLDEKMAEGGAKFEYSIDGTNWQENNVFENVDIGQVCAISVRYAETANYSVSQATAPVNAQSHTAKITLISRDKPEEGEDNEVLASFYTYVTEVEKENDLKELIGDIEKEEKKINYYSLTEDLEGKTSLKYPLELLGDVKIYTTLKAPSSGGGSGGGFMPKATVSPAPTATPAPSNSPTPTPTPSVTPGSSGKKNIPYMSGFDGMIKPDDYMTRAEAATIMVMVNGDTGEEYENVFPDVGEDTWYVRYIAEANARGLIEGFDDGNFYPEDTVTREQFAAMVVRMIGLEPIPGQTFADVDEQRWSAGSINAAVRAGIIEGYDDGTFLPENPTRRCEAARMINMAIGKTPNKALIDTLTCPYSDLQKNHWAYYELMIAATEFDIPE